MLASPLFHVCLSEYRNLYIMIIGWWSSVHDFKPLDIIFIPHVHTVSTHQQKLCHTKKCTELRM